MGRKEGYEVPTHGIGIGVGQAGWSWLNHPECAAVKGEKRRRQRRWHLNSTRDQIPESLSEIVFMNLDSGTGHTFLIEFSRPANQIGRRCRPDGPERKDESCCAYGAYYVLNACQARCDYRVQVYSTDFRCIASTGCRDYLVQSK